MKRNKNPKLCHLMEKIHNELQLPETEFELEWKRDKGLETEVLFFYFLH